MRTRHFLSTQTTQVQISTVITLSIQTPHCLPYSFLTLFCPEHVVCLLCLLHILNALQNTFTMEANIMNSDQTAPKGAV